MFSNRLQLSIFYTKSKRILNKNQKFYFNSKQENKKSIININYNDMSTQDKMLIQKVNYNLDLLIYHKKNSFLVQSLKNNIHQSNVNIHYIDDLITKMYISYSIREALELLSIIKLDNKTIEYYENEYIYRYYDNYKLELLFREIEDEIKLLYPLRNQFNLLPFYYNIYLNQMK